MSPDGLRVHAVLCHPADPRNVATAIRAVANHGLAGLRLVSRAPFDLDALRGLSCGAVDHTRFEVFDALAPALADCALVLGTSRRRHDPDGAAIWPAAGLGRRLAGVWRVAVLFGNERAGLSRDELDRCDGVVVVPTSEAFPSLNLAHAVTCIGYELARPEESAPPGGGEAAPPRTSAAARDAFFRQVEAACAALGYPPGRTPAAFARRLRRLLVRANPTSAELTMLAGVAREILSASRRNAGP